MAIEIHIFRENNPDASKEFKDWNNGLSEGTKILGSLALGKEEIAQLLGYRHSEHIDAAGALIFAAEIPDSEQ